MAIREDILLPLTQNKNKIPFDFHRKERIEKNISEIDKTIYADKPETSNLINLLRERLEAVNGKVLEINNKEELEQALKDIEKNNGKASYFTYNNDIKDGLPNLNWTDEITQSNTSITFCDYVIARTGTIMVSAASVKGRKVLSFPDIHIVIAEKDQIVFGLHEAIYKFNTNHKNNFPSFVSFITGPSKTADIEKTLILGAHGPKKIYLFLSNNKIL